VPVQALGITGGTPGYRDHSRNGAPLRVIDAIEIDFAQAHEVVPRPGHRMHDLRGAQEVRAERPEPVRWRQGLLAGQDYAVNGRRVPIRAANQLAVPGRPAENALYEVVSQPLMAAIPEHGRLPRRVVQQGLDLQLREIRSHSSSSTTTE
jgi:hypothetical protein